MAYVEIVPIKTNTHLSNSLDYIKDEKKTDNFALTDSYRCGFDTAEKSFTLTREKAIKKGNNLAWHIIQSFAPDDNVTHEQAMEIGKEMMKRMYPNYQYVIATHIDKGHIHNHIIMCSVDFENYHKLHSNKGSYAEMQNISDELCRANGLSVIERQGRDNKKRLRNAIDEAIEKSANINEFFTNMQKAGYNIKAGKYFSFKDMSMKRYMRSSSISIDYSKPMIEYRLRTKREPRAAKRTIYDDKINVRSLRERLRVELDASIKKARTYEEFISDMERKGYKAKRGKHLAFLGDRQERYIRTESLSYRYSEEIIRYKIEHREAYENQFSKPNVKEIIDRKDMSGGLSKWASKQNTQAIFETRKFLQENVHLSGSGDVNVWLGCFVAMYAEKKKDMEIATAKMNEIETKIKTVDSDIRTIQNYFRFKPIIEQYRKQGIENLSDEDKKKYKSAYAKYQYSKGKFPEIEKHSGTLSINELKIKLDELEKIKAAQQQSYVEKKLEFEDWKITKHNINSIDGFGVSDEQALAAYNKQQAINNRETEKKQKLDRLLNKVLGR